MACPLGCDVLVRCVRAGGACAGAGPSGVLNRGVVAANVVADGGDVVYRPLVRWAVRERGARACALILSTIGCGAPDRLSDAFVADGGCGGGIERPRRECPYGAPGEIV